MKPKKIVFLTGTRADIGKIQSLLQAVNKSSVLDLYVYVTGMHLSALHGSTYHYVQSLGVGNCYVDFDSVIDDETLHSSHRLAHIMEAFTKYVHIIKPDMVVVHGDRIEATAGALVAVLNNIRLAHIEGGEVSGTIDESLRHAISKLAHEHFVSTAEARDNLIKLGEDPSRVYVIGSPDMDAMHESRLPSLEEVKVRYEIPFEHYGIAMLHPTTTEHHDVARQADVFVKALKQSGKNWVVVYPNNDLGHDVILKAYEKLKGSEHIRLFPSIRFEYFLRLLESAELMIGNSSAGIREACVYGVPTIDIGTRQSNRYDPTKLTTIRHVGFELNAILRLIASTPAKAPACWYWGEGRSDALFLEVVESPTFWEQPLQKRLMYS